MTDIVSKATRSRMMSGIRGKNTKPEIKVRKYLFSQGFRYRIHDKRLPGKPDIYLPKFQCVIFTHGCFWHGHECKDFKWPQTNPDFWKNKINKTIHHDLIVYEQLAELGLKVVVIWECEIKRNWDDVKANLSEAILIL